MCRSFLFRNDESSMWTDRKSGRQCGGLSGGHGTHRPQRKKQTDQAVLCPHCLLTTDQAKLFSHCLLTTDQDKLFSHCLLTTDQANLFSHCLLTTLIAYRQNHLIYHFKRTLYTKYWQILVCSVVFPTYYLAWVKIVEYLMFLKDLNTLNTCL